MIGSQCDIYDKCCIVRQNPFITTARSRSLWYALILNYFWLNGVTSNQGTWSIKNKILTWVKYNYITSSIQLLSKHDRPMGKQEQLEKFLNILR